jgi:hypothetical protein
LSLLSRPAAPAFAPSSLHQTITVCAELSANRHASTHALSLSWPQGGNESSIPCFSFHSCLLANCIQQNHFVYSMIWGFDSSKPRGTVINHGLVEFGRSLLRPRRNPSLSVAMRLLLLRTQMNLLRARSACSFDHTTETTQYGTHACFHMYTTPYVWVYTYKTTSVRSV